MACVLNLKPLQEYIYTDLTDQGVVMFPPAISQLVSRSKCFQAHIFGEIMVPETRVIANRRDLITAMDDYSQKGIGRIITKRDRADCGLGINRWADCEDLFNHIAFNPDPAWPFVLQPFIPGATDIRVIWIGNHHREAYWRKNTAGFRNNLHFGGRSGAHKLTKRELTICRRAMDRGKFPYAHIDILKTGEGGLYLSEISLFGGTKGATIDSAQCARMKRIVEEEFLDSFADKKK